jgi:uncharacterized protein (DUF1501 family)
MKRHVTRRDFVKLGASAAATLGISGSLQANRAQAADVSGYKAIVCLFMFGGNNGFNWVVPMTSSAYSTYAKSRANLALASNSLLSLNGTASDGITYGMHSACPEIRSLYNAGKAAVICNVGTLVQPTTSAQAKAGSVSLPSQLFSHIDQETSWMTSIADSPERYGWAGRVADLLTSQHGTARVSYNIDIGGQNYWQEGRTATPYALGTGGASTLGVTTSTAWRNGSRVAAENALITQAKSDSNLMIPAYANIQNNSAAKVGIVNGAFSSAGSVSTSFPTYNGDSGLGTQLREVVQTIKAHAGIGDTRQFFFVQLGGFDTHNGELAAQQNLLGIVSKNINTFWNALGEIGMQNSVTLFTASDFGRSLGSNGDGSDHAWGNHALVLGGAVKGGKYYGKMPSLVMNGADDFGDGRIIPTTSTDQHAATLSKWFGVADGELNGVFPNLKNFATRDLGFMG